MCILCKNFEGTQGLNEQKSLKTECNARNSTLPGQFTVGCNPVFPLACKMVHKPVRFPLKVLMHMGF